MSEEQIAIAVTFTTAALFAILLVWQLPHFLAIATFRASEYGRAGLKVRPMASADAQRTIALVWRGRSPLGPALREIAGALRDAYPATNTRSARS